MAEDLLPNLALLERCSWTSKAIEEGHLFASIIMKQHKEYCENMMRCRAMICSVRVLLSRSADEKKLEVVQAQLARVKNQKPQRCGPRQMFTKDLIEMCESMRAKGRVMPQDAPKRVVRKTGRSWCMYWHRRLVDLRTLEAQLKLWECSGDHKGHSGTIVSAQSSLVVFLRYSTARV